MTFNSCLGLRSRSVVGFVVMLMGGVSSGCGGSGSTSDAEGVEAQTTQLDLTAGRGRIGGHGQAVGRLGQHCSPSGSHACAGHDQKGQLLCGASGRWQANGTCSAGNECDTTPGPSAGSCRPVMARCSQEDDVDDVLWHGREWKGRTPRICDYERCVDEQHHQHWHRVCKGACTPGAAQCSGNGVRTCDASGRWDAAVACVNQACDAATGACTGVCAPGAIQCSGNGVQTCDPSGQWGAAEPCVNQACDAATGTCTGLCAPGATQCSGNGVQTCDPTGQWDAAVACVNQACDGATGACTGVCTPGAAQCSGNGVQTCDASGRWGAAVACNSTTSTCVSGACVPLQPLPACLHASYEIPFSGQSCTQRMDVPGTGCGPGEPPSCYGISGTASVALSFDQGWQVTIVGFGFGSGTYPLLSSSSGIWRAESGGSPMSAPYAEFTVDCGAGSASISSSLPGSRISMCTFRLPELLSGNVVCNAATGTCSG